MKSRTASSAPGQTLGSNTSALEAAWVLPVSGPPIRNGRLVIAGEHIIAVQSQDCSGDTDSINCTPDQIIDYGQAVIVPGFINLHTHLEYSACRHVNTQAGLLDWIPMLMASVASWGKADWQASALYGAGEIIASGTTCICDSAYTGQAAWAAAQTGLRALVGLELFGCDSQSTAANWQRWQARYEQVLGELEADPVAKAALVAGRVQITCAPHSPYTVAPSLLTEADSWSQSRNLPLLVHLAESAAECRWLAGQDAAMDSFLAGRPGLNAEIVAAVDWKGRGLSPVRHMDRYGLLSDRLVAAHCVHVSDDDIGLLSARGVKVAACPRSNARLRNGISPLAQLLDAGVALGFGTDSAASCDDLDVLSEARFAWNLHKAINPTGFALSATKALEHLTAVPARIIGMGDSLGTLEPGKLADIAVFKIGQLPEASRQQPAEALFFGGAVLVGLYVNGCQVVQKDAIITETID